MKIGSPHSVRLSLVAQRSSIGTAAGQTRKRWQGGEVSAPPLPTYNALAGRGWTGAASARGARASRWKSAAAGWFVRHGPSQPLAAGLRPVVPLVLPHCLNPAHGTPASSTVAKPEHGCKHQVAQHDAIERATEAGEKTLPFLALLQAFYQRLMPLVAVLQARAEGLKVRRVGQTSSFESMPS